MQNARVVALQISERKHARPSAVAEVEGRVGGGLIGDSHVDRTKRAVVVVDESTLAAHDLRPGDLKEQITVSGMPLLTELPEGTRLRVGGITLRVNGPCEPCVEIGEQLGVSDPEALRRSLDGRRGVVCTVVSTVGPARVGDGVDVIFDVVTAAR